MKYRKFEKIAEEVSIFGLGCMRFPTNKGSIDEEITKEFILYGIDNGINYLDTANYEPKDEAHFEYSWQWAYEDRFKEAFRRQCDAHLRFMDTRLQDNRGTRAVTGRGLALLEGYRLFGNREYYRGAQRAIDWMLGANRFEASMVNGVGMNQQQLDATRLQEQVITDPDSLDIHDVTIAMSKARMSLNLAQSVIDRLISGWNEISTTR